MKKIKLDFEPRPQQLEILNFVKQSIEEDEKKFIMIDAPTGVGKSFAAVMICVCGNCFLITVFRKNSFPDSIPD